MYEPASSHTCSHHCCSVIISICAGMSWWRCSDVNASSCFIVSLPFILVLMLAVSVLLWFYWMTCTLGSFWSTASWTSGSLISYSPRGFLEFGGLSSEKIVTRSITIGSLDLLWFVICPNGIIFFGIIGLLWCELSQYNNQNRVPSAGFELCYCLHEWCVTEVSVPDSLE